jgi:hypothetical protein
MFGGNKPMIIETIDSYLKTRPKDKRTKNCFHPSSLHKSAKKLYHLYLEGDNNQEFEPRIKRIFDNGHGVHERLQTYLENPGILLQAEVQVESKEYEITGHTDGILEINGVKGILEIKSMNANTFYSTYDPKPEHLIQVNIYMFCTGIERACLLYECKDDQALKEFYVKQDEAILDPTLDKIRYVQKCLRKGKVPE